MARSALAHPARRLLRDETRDARPRIAAVALQLQPERPAARDHAVHDLPDKIFANVELPRDLAPQARQFLAQQSRGVAPPPALPCRSEQPPQRRVDARRTRTPVARGKPGVVSPERQFRLAHVLHHTPRANGRRTAAQFAHQPIHVLQLTQGRRPGRVTPPPARAGSEPYGERFGEVFRRVALCIPTGEMLYVTPAAGSRPVAAGIPARRRPEGGTPAGPPPQPEGVVDGVAGLMAQDAHEFFRVTALDLAASPLLQRPQARMQQIE